jgi:hypothetical protein
MGAQTGGTTVTDKAEEGVADAVSQETAGDVDATTERRQILKRLGRFAAVTAPAVTLLLAATAKPREALAIS